MVPRRWQDSAKIMPMCELARIHQDEMVQLQSRRMSTCFCTGADFSTAGDYMHPSTDSLNSSHHKEVHLKKVQNDKESRNVSRSGAK